MGRITSRDINKAIFRPQDKNDNPELLTKVYTITGNENQLDDEGYPILLDEPYEEDGQEYIDPAELRDEAYAKYVRGQRVKYYVKQDNAGHFYNPIGLYGKQKQRKGSQDVWRFRETSKQAFELYIKFLKTRNVAWLQQAERE